VLKLHQANLLDTTVIHGDGTTTAAKKGGDNIGSRSASGSEIASWPPAMPITINACGHAEPAVSPNSSGFFVTLWREFEVLPQPGHTGVPAPDADTAQQSS
jgi:hypothetical protein